MYAQRTYRGMHGMLSQYRLIISANHVSANISANHVSHHREVAHARVEESTSEWVGDEEHEGGGRGEGGDEMAELGLRRIRAESVAAPGEALMHSAMHPLGDYSANIIGVPGPSRASAARTARNRRCRH